MPEPFKIAVLSNPLGDVDAGFAEKAESGVKFVGHNALVFPVVVADDVMPGGQLPRVNRPRILEIQTHAEGQRFQVVSGAVHRKALLPAE